MRSWWVYILQCADNTLYTGVTIDIKRRISEHNESHLGASYTRARRPVQLVYLERIPGGRAQALCREHNIKKHKKSQKLVLVRKNYSASVCYARQLAIHLLAI